MLGSAHANYSPLFGGSLAAMHAFMMMDIMDPRGRSGTSKGCIAHADKYAKMPGEMPEQAAKFLSAAQ